LVATPSEGQLLSLEDAPVLVPHYEQLLESFAAARSSPNAAEGSSGGSAAARGGERGLGRVESSGGLTEVQRWLLPQLLKGGYETETYRGCMVCAPGRVVEVREAVLLAAAAGMVEARGDYDQEEEEEDEGGEDEGGMEVREGGSDAAESAMMGPEDIEDSSLEDALVIVERELGGDEGSETPGEEESEVDQRWEEFTASVATLDKLRRNSAAAPAAAAEEDGEGQAAEEEGEDDDAEEEGEGLAVEKEDEVQEGAVSTASEDVDQEVEDDEDEEEEEEQDDADSSSEQAEELRCAPTMLLVTASPAAAEATAAHVRTALQPLGLSVGLLPSRKEEQLDPDADSHTEGGEDGEGSRGGYTAAEVESVADVDVLVGWDEDLLAAAGGVGLRKKQRVVSPSRVRWVLVEDTGGAPSGGRRWAIASKVMEWKSQSAMWVYVSEVRARPCNYLVRVLKNATCFMLPSK
jgi:hypothetical protein